MSKLVVRSLEGLLDYEPVNAAMHHFTDGRDESTVDEFWLLEHAPVYTQGQAGKAEHVLAAGDIPVIQTDRGGQVTYHGPGQLVIYLMLDLERKKIGPRDLVSLIEEAIVELLSQYDVAAYPKADAPGVYVDEQKIASLGLRIRKRKSFHGLALNVDMDLEPFLRINPCGYAGLKMTQLSAFAENLSISSVSEGLVKLLSEKLNYQTIEFRTGLPSEV